VPLTKEFANESLPSIKANLTSNDITSFDNLKEEVHYEIYYAGKYETKDGETFHWGYYYYVNYYFENTNYVYIISNQYRYLTPNALF
jgi:hypothetical protein